MLTPDDLEKLISPARFSTFVELSSGNRYTATRLYAWTGRLAGALLTDFRHLEIVFRNRVDQALMAYARSLDHSIVSWLDDSWLPARTNGWDEGANKAIRQASKSLHGARRSHDATIANLTFSFWRYVIAGRYEEAFWLPALDAAFIGIPGATSVDRRTSLENALIDLSRLRNRIAHHEPICKPWTRSGQGGAKLILTVDAVYESLREVLHWCGASSAAYFLEQSCVPGLLATRPR